MRPVYDKVFSQCPAPEFIGRDAETDAILSLAKSEGPPGKIVVLAAPRVGASELLRQAYDRLFLEPTDTVPFYFRFSAADRTAQRASLRFAYEFLLQTVAFSRRDAGIIFSSPGLNEIAQLASPRDGYWVDRLVELTRHGRDADFNRDLIGAPQRAAANGARPLVMIDDLHLATRLAGGDRLLDDLLDMLSLTICPMVIGGLRRFLFGKAQGDIIDLDAFATDDAGRFVEVHASRAGVEVNDRTRDLVAVQLAGNAGHMAGLIEAAGTNGADLLSFEDVERLYIDDVFGGSIGRYFDNVMAAAGSGGRVLGLLGESLDAPGGSLPRTYWEKQTGRADAGAVIAMLHHYEIVNDVSGAVTVDAENAVLTDCIRARAQLELEGRQRALTVGQALAMSLQRGPQLMARSYRRAAAIGLKELLESFDGRHVSGLLLDYERFRNEVKGAADDKLRRALKEDNQRLRLPQIVFAAHAAAYYPPLREVSDTERAAVAVGFLDGARRQPTAWLAVEIDSKLEAKRDLTEFWCDRLEMAAVACGFSQFTLWLIAPEGFTPDASEALRERSAYGTSRRQVQLLAETLLGETAGPEPVTGKVYEFDVSMGSGGEIATAQNVEEIGRRHKLPPKVVNQLKTAIIEACINAAEHSLSPDGIIHQKFIVEPDKVTVTVTNRGVRLADKSPVNDAKDERRGWGLKLIEGLTDRLVVEDTDDGTSLTITKLLTANRS
jgi:serine/threonine-protein kinase RsbW